MGSNLLSLSIVIEWENARLSEADRALRMLEELSAQLLAETRGSSRPVEILLLHNPEAVPAATIEGMIDGVRPRGQWPARFRIVASGERTYYEQKNFGVANTTGDVVLFVDSDVVPEPGWLRTLLAGFDDPEVGVVCGSTYVEPASFYERAMALFWLFPLRRPEEGVEEAQSFHANNVAFRREVISVNPFPELPYFRGQCRALARGLRESGVAIVRHTGARVSHPPPNGLRHFVNRAMAEGHDEALRERRRGRKPVKSSFKSFGRRTRAAMGDITHRYHEVGLSPVGAAGACGLAVSYYALRLTGQLLTWANPEIVRRHFAI